MIPWKVTRPNRRAIPLRIRCHSNRWQLACRESESIFLVNVSTEINTATFLHEAGIPESLQYVESSAGLPAPECLQPQESASARCAISCTSRDSFGASA